MAENKEILRESYNQQEIKKTGPETINTRETYARVPPEVKSWMQKLEEDPASMKTITDDQGRIVLQPTTNQNPKIQLPVGRNKFVAGFKKKIDEAGRWLSAFILKLIKKSDGNVKFKEE